MASTRRPIIPDIQFFAHDGDAVRLEKLRRLAQSIADYMRSMQPAQTTVTPTVGFTMTGPALLGRVTATGDAIALMPAQVTAMLTTFTVIRKGLVPPPGSISTANNRFLHESGSWQPIDPAGIDHGDLAGLADDDHPQYLLRSDFLPFARAFLFMGA